MKIRTFAGFFVVIVLLIALDPGRTVFANPSQVESSESGTSQGIILFIGDGMGANHRLAAQWVAYGQDGHLEMDQLPFAGWSQTASADNAITDSAAGATALATGTRTNNSYISVDPNKNMLETILEQAQEKGLAVGLVTTTQMAHATPAAFASHVESRYYYTEIAAQMIAHHPEVLLGGGENDFLPVTRIGCYPGGGKRTDGRDLIIEAVVVGYTYICDATEFAQIDPESTTHLLGLFADDGMIRPYQPSLAQMTQMAIDVLSHDPKGFFLMVEGGQIDWAAHSNLASETITDVLGLDDAISVAVNYAQNSENTLIIVVADHETGGMSLSLEPSGAAGEDGPIYMPDGTPFYVNWTSSGHTAADIPVTAQGYFADQLVGTFENTFIHKVMRQALGWEIYLPSIESN